MKKGRIKNWEMGKNCVYVRLTKCYACIGIKVRFALNKNNDSDLTISCAHERLFSNS
jgi:hypothetical protein